MTRAERQEPAGERRYRGLFDQSMAGMAIMDVDGTVTRVNDALGRLLGRDEADLLGLTLPQLGHPDDADRHGGELRRVLAGEVDGLHGQRRLLRADGEVVHVAISASLVRDEAGRPEQFVAQLIDVTALIEGRHAPSDGQEQFPGVFDNILVGMVATAPDGRILRVNRAMCDLLGHSAEELTARTTDDITHPDDIAASTRLVRSCLAGEIPGFSLDARYLHADGHAVTVALVAELVRDEDGRPLHFATQLTDIGERRTLQDQLRGQHYQYARLLEGLSELGEGVVVDDDGRVVYANDALCGLTGHTRDGLLAMDAVSELVASRDEEKAHPVDGGDMRRGTMRLRHRDGHEVPAEFASIPIRLDGHVGQLTVVRDLSERQRANVELQAAAQFKTDLLAMLSHDIGQPLTAIRGYAQLLVTKWDSTTDETRLMLLARMRANAERLGEMVAQILAMGAAEGAVLEATPEPVSAAVAVARALASISAVPGVFVGDVTDAPVLADPGHLQQILVNLVGNAGKYGRPPIEVSAAAAGDGRVEFRVRDHGDGVHASFVPHMFERYTRAGAAQAAGTGLGLFIVQRLAEANGGEVVYADAGPGASFVLRLPMADGVRETVLPVETHASGG